MLLPAPPLVIRKPRQRMKIPKQPVIAGPLVVTAVSMTVTESGDGVIHFASTGGTGPAIITAVDSVSQLEIEFDGEWRPCDVVVEFSDHTITLQGPSGIHPGDAWRVLTADGGCLE